MNCVLEANDMLLNWYPFRNKAYGQQWRRNSYLWSNIEPSMAVLYMHSDPCGFQGLRVILCSNLSHQYAYTLPGYALQLLR